MAGRNVPVVIVPRFSSYVGPGNFYGMPIPVSAYDRLNATLWIGQIQGSGTNMSVSVEESNDLSTWDNLGGIVLPAAGAESQGTFDLTMAWMRFGVHLTGSNAAITCWAEGFFELRER